MRTITAARSSCDAIAFSSESNAEDEYRMDRPSALLLSAQMNVGQLQKVAYPSIRSKGAHLDLRITPNASFRSVERNKMSGFVAQQFGLLNAVMLL